MNVIRRLIFRITLYPNSKGNFYSFGIRPHINASRVGLVDSRLSVGSEIKDPFWKRPDIRSTVFWCVEGVLPCMKHSMQCVVFTSQCILHSPEKSLHQRLHCGFDTAPDMSTSSSFRFTTIRQKPAANKDTATGVGFRLVAINPKGPRTQIIGF